MSDIKIITNHSKIADKESNIEEYEIDSNQAPSYAMNSPIYREMLRHEKEMKRLLKESGDLLHLLHPDSPGGCNGRGHSKNPAHYYDYWHNFFPHRSEHEVKLHKAFQKTNHQLAKKYGKEYQFPFWVLPVAICGDKRVELDFFIVINGTPIGIEVDGPSHIGKLHFDEENRLDCMKMNDIKVFRFKSEEENWADKAIRKIFKYLKKKGVIKLDE